MNRRLLIPALLGLLAGLAAFAAVYSVTTRESRALLRQPRSELAWLKREFRLTDEQFNRVNALHEAYLPTCAELCRRVADHNRQLREATLAQRELTPTLENLLAETGRLRDDCRRAMLGHVYRVARELPPDAARQYLAFMLDATCIIEDAHPVPSGPAPHPSHPHHE